MCIYDYFCPVYCCYILCQLEWLLNCYTVFCKAHMSLHNWSEFTHLLDLCPTVELACCSLHLWDYGVFSLIPFIAVRSCFKQLQEGNCTRKKFNYWKCLYRSVCIRTTCGSSWDFSQSIIKNREGAALSTLDGGRGNYLILHRLVFCEYSIFWFWYFFLVVIVWNPWTLPERIKWNRPPSQKLVWPKERNLFGILYS